MQYPLDVHLADHGQIKVRLLQPSDDLQEMTELLNRAYAPLAAAGMRYVASWQDVEITRSRIQNSDVLLGFLNANIVATATIKAPDSNNKNPYYRQADVAHLEQFAVDPRLQSCGLGSQILGIIERHAGMMGYRGLAVDTSEHAHSLIAYYTKRGYKDVGQQDWQETNYVSRVFSKQVNRSSPGKF